MSKRISQKEKKIGEKEKKKEKNAPIPEMSLLSQVSQITHMYCRNANVTNQTKVKNFAL